MTEQLFATVFKAMIFLMNTLHFIYKLPLMLFARYVITEAEEDTGKIISYRFYFTMRGVTKYLDIVADTTLPSSHIMMIEKKPPYSIYVKGPGLIKEYIENKKRGAA